MTLAELILISGTFGNTLAGLRAYRRFRQTQPLSEHLRDEVKTIGIAWFITQLLVLAAYGLLKAIF